MLMRAQCQWSCRKQHQSSTANVHAIVPFQIRHTWGIFKEQAHLWWRGRAEPPPPLRGYNDICRTLVAKSYRIGGKLDGQTFRPTENAEVLTEQHRRRLLPLCIWVVLLKSIGVLMGFLWSMQAACRIMDYIFSILIFRLNSSPAT